MTPATSNITHLGARRLPALDGLRGLLALVVFAFHLSLPLGVTLLAMPANFAVVGFFTLSGFVLTRSWDGRFGLFLARRFARLWPVYGLCLAAGYAIAHIHPLWSQFLWYPLLTANAKPEIDPPIWSLCVEAWAMLFMPFFVWAGSGKLWRAAFGVTATLLAATLYTMFLFGAFFIAGAYLSRWDFRNVWLESAPAQWLGRVSYSLYLSHWLVFKVALTYFGEPGLVASAPLALALGWLIWRFVETPSIWLSRRVDAVWRSAASPPPAIAPAE